MLGSGPVAKNLSEHVTDVSGHLALGHVTDVVTWL